jgi:hypothetical protein
VMTTSAGGWGLSRGEMAGAMPSSTSPCWLDPLAGPCGGTRGSKGQREPDARALAGAWDGEPMGADGDGIAQGGAAELGLQRRDHPGEAAMGREGPGSLLHERLRPCPQDLYALAELLPDRTAPAAAVLGDSWAASTTSLASGKEEVVEGRSMAGRQLPPLPPQACTARFQS